MATRSRWIALLAGSLGLGFVLAALAVLVWQVLDAVEHRSWTALTTRHLLNDGLVRSITPGSVRAWIDRPPSSGGPLHGAVTWFVDQVPLAAVLGGIALVLLWQARRSERSGAVR